MRLLHVRLLPVCSRRHTGVIRLLLHTATCSLLRAGHNSRIWGFLGERPLILLETLRIRVSVEYLLDLLHIGVVIPLCRDMTRRERLHIANLSLARLFTAAAGVLYRCWVVLTFFLTSTCELFASAELWVLLLLKELLLGSVLLMHRGLATILGL